MSQRLSGTAANATDITTSKWPQDVTDLLLPPATEY